MSRLKSSCRACYGPCSTRELLCFTCWMQTPGGTREGLVTLFMRFRRAYEKRHRQRTDKTDQLWLAWAERAIEIIEMVNPESHWIEYYRMEMVEIKNENLGPGR